MTWTPELVGPTVEARFPANDSEDFADLVLLEANIRVRLAAFSAELLEFTQDCFGAMTNSTTFVTIALITVTIAGVFLFATFSIVLRNGLGSIRVFLRLLLPRELVQDSELVLIILCIDAGANTKVLTPSEVAVQRASEGIISLSLDYTIEAVNAAFTDETGRNPDEVTGQNLQLIFPFPGADDTSADNSVAALHRHLEQLKDGSTTAANSIDVNSTHDVGPPLNMSVMVMQLVI
jgi:PAS domain-containing protein